MDQVLEVSMADVCFDRIQADDKKAPLVSDIPLEYRGGTLLVEPEPFDFDAFAERISAELEPKINHIMVVMDEAPKVTLGGLVIPDKAQMAPSTGRVCAMSGTLRDIYGGRIRLEIGQRVYLSKYGGNTINYEGVEVENINVNTDTLAFFPRTDNLSVYVQDDEEGEDE